MIYHVRTAKSSSTRGGIGRYSALKELGKVETICGAPGTTYDVTPIDVRNALRWRVGFDFVPGRTICQTCKQGVNA